MEKQPILVEKRSDGIAVITLNNPPLNLRTMESTLLLEKAAKELDQDERVRVVILRGCPESRSFSAGSDVKEFPVLREKGNFAEDKVRRENAVFTRFERMRKPTVAAIHAIALGGGLELALACDFRVLDETAAIGQPEINLAAFPAGGGTIRLVKLVGYSKAMELICTGKIITAQEAKELRLVNIIAPAGQAYECALQLAFELSQKSAVVVRSVKKLLLDAVTQTIDQGVDDGIRAFEEICDTPDALEGTKAFFEKRPPVFMGAPREPYPLENGE